MKLSTIGYEGTDIERFVAAIEAAGIKVLADVRAVPLSRKKGFSKSRLAKRLERAGIAYRHFKDLGTPKKGRVAAHAGRREEFHKIFARHMQTTAAQSALADLKEVSRREPTCLMCFERDPALCHRSVVAGMMGRRVAVRHLFAELSTP